MVDIKLNNKNNIIEPIIYNSSNMPLRTSKYAYTVRETHSHRRCYVLFL